MTHERLAFIVLKFNAYSQELQTYAATMPERPEVSNCLLFAMRMRALYGGEIVYSVSEYFPGDHAQWIAPSGERWEYAPIDDKYRRADVPTLFEGRPVRVA